MFNKHVIDSEFMKYESLYEIIREIIILDYLVIFMLNYAPLSNMLSMMDCFLRVGTGDQTQQPPQQQPP